MSDQTSRLMDLFSKLMMQPFFIGAIRRNEYVHRQGDLQNGRGRERFLKLLSEQDGLTNSEIVELLDIRPSSVSAMVKRLEESGIVERRPLASDGRKSAVYLTEKGKKLLDSASQNHDEISELFFDSLTSEEQAQLRDLLSKLLDGMAEFQMPEGKVKMMKFMRHGHPFFPGGPRGFNHGDWHQDPFQQDEFNGK